MSELPIDLDLAVAEAVGRIEEKTDLRLDPGQPALVADDEGGYWAADLTEAERDEIRAWLRQHPCTDEHIDNCPDCTRAEDWK
jgi:hypothetical protein